MSVPDETRKVKRININVPLTFRIHPSMEKQITLSQHEVTAHTVDISSTGIGLITNLYIPAGAILSIQIARNIFYPKETVEDKYVQLTGEVTSARMEEGKYRLGILLKELSEENRIAIKKIMESTT